MKIFKANVDGHLLMVKNLKGCPIATIVNGKIKMKNGKIIGSPEWKAFYFN